MHAGKAHGAAELRSKLRGCTTEAEFRALFNKHSWEDNALRLSPAVLSSFTPAVRAIADRLREEQRSLVAKAEERRAEAKGKKKKNGARATPLAA